MRRKYLIQNQVLQIVAHAFSLVTRHFRRPLNPLRAKPPTQHLGIRCETSNAQDPRHAGVHSVTDSADIARVLRGEAGSIRAPDRG